FLESLLSASLSPSSTVWLASAPVGSKSPMPPRRGAGLSPPPCDRAGAAASSAAPATAAASRTPLRTALDSLIRHPLTPLHRREWLAGTKPLPGEVRPWALGCDSLGGGYPLGGPVATIFPRTIRSRLTVPSA